MASVPLRVQAVRFIGKRLALCYVCQVKGWRRSQLTLSNIKRILEERQA